jgi:hypothetical protein
VSEVVQTAEEVVRLLEEVLEKLQAAQTSIPAPTLQEIAEIRQGKQPLTEQAYLLGLFQRAILAAENVASDLRAIDLETLRNVHELNLSAVELNAIEQAVAERPKGGAGVQGRDGE